MHQDVIDALLKLPPDEQPRLFYFGHKLIRSHQLPSRDADWKCTVCQYKWTAYSGVQCPTCKDCKHEWWDDGPNGSKQCTFCDIPYLKEEGK